MQPCALDRAAIALHAKLTQDTTDGAFPSDPQAFIRGSAPKLPNDGADLII